MSKKLITTALVLLAGVSGTMLYYQSTIPQYKTNLTYTVRKNIESPYKTQEEWKKAYQLEKYLPNQEITGEYNKSLAATASNGTFVGEKEGNVIAWKGIPFAMQPVGERRFQKAIDPEPSDKVYEAYHFAPSCMQPIDTGGEKASLYEQSEACLNLNIWKNVKGTEKKPVLVFVHGGGWLYGGPADPLYNGHFFVQNNPDVMLVTVTYRMGMMGMINLSGFEDGAEYETSINNGIFDLVQSLKWIKDNIAAFGGDPENVTLAGESAGGGAVSTLCTLPEAKGLFQKAIPMSGSVNQGNNLDKTLALPEALKKDLNVETVKDLQALDFQVLRDYWDKNAINLYTLLVRDGKIVPEDPFKRWEDGMSKDLVIMQGHTTNEFRYYQEALSGDEGIYDAICRVSFEEDEEAGTEEFKQDLAEYKKALLDLGYPENEVVRRYMDDKSLSIGNTYQAVEHSKNGGISYSYTFEKPYDYPEYLGAAHAIDCFYLFGTFDGVGAKGTKEEVDLALEYQKMIANFVKTGDPSTEKYPWPVYDNETRQKMMIGDNMRVEENPEKARVDAALKMMKSGYQFRYVNSLADHFAVIEKRYPDVFQHFLEKAMADRQKLETELQK